MAVNDRPVIPSLPRNNLTTSDVADAFEGLIQKADEDVENFIGEHTANGVLEMSASESLELQQLMADQSIAAQGHLNA